MDEIRPKTASPAAPPEPRRALAGKAFRFVIAGGPAFALAVPLNWLLVSFLQLNPALAYALVLAFQLTVNFFLCRLFVFRTRQPIRSQLPAFLAGFLLFRLADWSLYSYAVNVLGFYYLYVQCFNVLAFMTLKFLFARKIMES